MKKMFSMLVALVAFNSVAVFAEENEKENEKEIVAVEVSAVEASE